MTEGPGPPGEFVPPTGAPPPPGPPPAPYAPPPPYPASAAQPGRRTSGQAVAALVLGICGLIILPVVCSVLAMRSCSMIRA